jgi:hypothetical protein
MPLNEKELEILKPHLNAENAKLLTAENGAKLLTSQMVALSQEAIKLQEQYELFNPYHDEGGRFSDSGGAGGHTTSSAAHAATAEHLGSGGGAKNVRVAKMHEEAAKHGGIKQADREYHEAAGRAFRSGSKSAHEDAAKFAEHAGMKDAAAAHRDAGGSKGLAMDMLEIDPDALDAHVESAETKLNTLVTSGAITPAVQKALSAVLVGAENSRNVYALSRKATGAAKSITNLVLDALKDNRPLKVGEKTGPQSATRELSRNADEEKEQQKMLEVMANAANHVLKK